VTTLTLTQTSRRSLTLTAWSILLLFSMLPNILIQELTGAPAPWLLPVKLVGLTALAVICFLTPTLRPLVKFVLILLAIYVVEASAFRLSATSLWQTWFPGRGVPFTQEMFGIQVQRLLVAILMIAVLLALGFKRRQFYLRMGDLRAPVEPVRLPGFPNQKSWSRFGAMWAVFISLGLLIFLIIGGRPVPAQLLGVLPMLPFIFILAAMNAFGEEVTYRSALLAPLVGVLGTRQAVYLAAVFFGIGHFYGVPYGLIGVVMASFLGWLLGKAMVETNGFFWAWFIHFIQDVLIFSFMAVGSITPGG
jgi:membrane protease YdiL (CAAX protease family)